MISGKQRLSPIQRELQKITKKERKFLLHKDKWKTGSSWKTELEKRIPEKVSSGLHKAFLKAFCLVFEKGVPLIEKTYDKDSIEKEFQIKDYAMNLKGGRKEIRRLKKDASGKNALNTAVTAVEGMALGALGIGLPDIVVWLGVLLRGIYETALQYGFEYETPEEKMFVLKLMEAAMLDGEERIVLNEQADTYIWQDAHVIPEETELRVQIGKTADAFATEMLFTKFLQGLPVVGMLGGAANPVYYHRIMGYVQLKYRKRYLVRKIKEQASG